MQGREDDARRMNDVVVSMMNTSLSNQVMFRRGNGARIVPLLFLCLVSMPVQSSQVLPGVEIECQDSAEHIDSSPSHPTRSTYFECQVENTSTVTEEIEMQYSGEELSVIGPTTIILGPGNSEVVTVQARAPVHMEAGDYDSTITAVVRRVAGAPLGAFAQSDSDDITLTVDPYMNCDIYNTPEEIKVGSDRKIQFNVVLDCSSNLEDLVNVRFVMIERDVVDSGNSGTKYWPDGFQDRSPLCEVTTEIGFTTHDCTFVADSKSTSLSSLNVCLAIQLDGEEKPEYCSSNPIKLEKVLLGFGSTGSMGVLVPFLLVILVLLSSIIIWKRVASDTH